MDKRFQVFVSSTYEDLHEERREVMQALLALDCIPTGMELFPAADDDSWTHIRRFIAGCDYYIVIVGGRYGSRAPTGKSFTEMEYDLAVESDIPVLAFLHKNPGTIPANKTEPSDDGKTALATFRQKIENARHAKYWSAPGELAGAVALGLASLIKIKPRVGWVRADLIPDEGTEQELLRLRREIEQLTGDLALARAQSAPDGTQDFAQGDDETDVNIDFPSENRSVCILVRWSALMRAVLPRTFGGGAVAEGIAAAICGAARSEGDPFSIPSGFLPWGDAALSAGDFGKITNQMVALGLIAGFQHPLHPIESVWKATPFGVRTGSRLLAIKRGS